MKRITFLLFMVLSVVANAQTNPWQFASIEDCYGKMIYISISPYNKNHTYSLVRDAADLLLFEKKAGKYKKTSVSEFTDFMGETRYKVKEAPGFLENQSYIVLGECLVDGVPHIRLQQEIDSKTSVILLPKQFVKEKLLSQYIYSPTYIDSVFYVYKESFHYIDKGKAEIATQDVQKISNEYFSRGTVINAPIKLGDASLCPIEWLDYTLVDAKHPFNVSIKLGKSDMKIHYATLEKLLNACAFVTDAQYDSLEYYARIQDSIDNARDNGVFIGKRKYADNGISTSDEIAFYFCEGTGAFLEFYGICRGREVKMNELEFSFDNPEDADYLKKKKTEGKEARRKAANDYSAHLLQKAKQDFSGKTYVMSDQLIWQKKDVVSNEEIKISDVTKAFWKVIDVKQEGNYWFFVFKYDKWTLSINADVFLGKINGSCNMKGAFELSEWKEFVKDYGATMMERVLNHGLKAGMPSYLVMLSWGCPDDVNTTSNGSSTHEQWVYNHSRSKTYYVYLTNGKVTSWQM